MDLSYGPAHEAFRAQLRAFLIGHRDRYPKAQGEGRPGPEMLAWQQLLIEHGYAARTVPRSYGGYGAPADLLCTQIISEELIGAGAPFPLANQGISMLVPTLLELGREDQKRAFIPPTLRGELIWCQGYSEPGAGSDLAALATHAREDATHFIVNGQKIWTSTAQLADMMFCLVRTEPDAPKHQGISYLLVDMKSSGIVVRPLRTMTGHSEFNEVFLSDVRVPKANVVGERGQGWFVANATLKHERGMLGDPNVADARIHAITELLRVEEVSGARLMDNLLYRDRLMRLQARALALRCNAMRLLSAAANGEDGGLARLVVKLEGCELNHQLAALAIDLLGELGTLYEGSSHLRDGGRWQRSFMFDLGLIIGGGTAQIQKNIIAERGLGLPREPHRARS